MNQISIGAENWIAGITSSKYSSDGGFSPLLKGHNINYEKGLLYPAITITKQNDLTAEYVGIAFSDKNYLSNRLFATYKSSGTSLKIVDATVGDVLSTSTGVSHSNSTSDFIYNGSKYYLTSYTDVTQISQNGATVDNAWWTTTKGGAALTTEVPHHFAALADYTVITDGNKLHKINDDNTIAEAVLTLPTSELIQTAVSHNNKVYLSISNSSESYNYITSWDGNADDLLGDKITAPGKMTTLFSYNGYIYGISKFGIYFFNGQSFEKIRSLGKTILKTQLTYLFGNVYMAGGNDVTKSASDQNILVFNGTAFSHLYGGSYAIQTLGMNNTTKYIYTVSNEDLNYLQPVSYANTYSGKFSTSTIDFIANVWIRKVVFEFGAVMATDDSNTFSINDQNETSMATLVASYAVQGAKRCVEFKDLNIGNGVNSITISSEAFTTPIKRIDIFFDIDNTPIK